MHQEKIGPFLSLFNKKQGYTKPQSAIHEVWHITGGLFGGPDFFAADPLECSNKWFSNVVGDYSGYGTRDSFCRDLEKASDNRLTLFKNAKQHAGFIHKVMGKRMEAIVAFLARTRTAGEYTRAVTISNYSDLDCFVDVPFYVDDLCLHQHIAYYNSRLVLPHQKDTYFLSELVNNKIEKHLRWTIPATSKQLDRLIAETIAYGKMPHCVIHSGNSTPQKGNSFLSNDDHYQVFYDIKPLQPHKGAHIAYSKETVCFASPEPLLYETPFRHALFGPKMRVYLARLPQALDMASLPSFHQCMDDLSQNLLLDTFVTNFTKHKERWDKNTPLEIDVPYKEKMYHAYVGPQPVVTIPKEYIVSSFDIKTHDLCATDGKNNDKIARKIKNNFKLL